LTKLILPTLRVDAAIEQTGVRGGVDVELRLHEAGLKTCPLFKQ
jgi:hypothetical protein